VAVTAHRWRQDGEAEGNYDDLPGFCRSVKVEEIMEHGYVLTPGRYVGAEAVEDDDEAFAEKMERLNSLLHNGRTESSCSQLTAPRGQGSRHLQVRWGLRPPVHATRLRQR
jgi:hypothetical protein